MGKIQIIYEFVFPGGVKKPYTIEFDSETVSYQAPADSTLPEWTKLENNQCAHCPLKPKESPHCPIAANLSHMVEFFKDKASFSDALVVVKTQERNYIKQLKLQEGMFSAFGLVMSLSACPYMSFLKPMGRFHLPFSTVEETIVRSVSFWLMKQYFVAKKGGKPDMNLSELEAHYENLKTVNLGIIARIRGIAKKDADVNALLILHSFTDLLQFAIGKNLSDLEPLF